MVSDNNVDSVSVLMETRPATSAYKPRATAYSQYRRVKLKCKKKLFSGGY